MSNSYDTNVSEGTRAGTVGSPGTLDTAAPEASSLKQTATEQAKGVVDTAKDEASSVVSEAKYQAKDLYAQTQRELKDQASTQQQRIAGGLRSVSDELNSMAANSQSNGLASDLVRQVSGRLSTASTWLGDRDPSSLLQEVKGYARRKPGVFILGAAVAGVLVGRLTRALAANASSGSDAGTSRAGSIPTRQPDAWAPPTSVPVVAPAAAGIDETPIYAQSADVIDGAYTEDDNVRRDSF
jgi:vacuolar-type H+-ATPase subunit H